MRNSEMVIACDLFVMRSVLLPLRRLKEAAADSFFGPLWPFARSSFQFAAVQESAFGTKQTCQSCRSMSAFGGKADISCSDRVFPLLTQSGHVRARSQPHSGCPWPVAAVPAKQQMPPTDPIDIGARLRRMWKA